MFAMSHALSFTLCFVLLHMLMISLKPPFSCCDALPHLQYCRISEADWWPEEKMYNLYTAVWTHCLSSMFHTFTWAVPGSPKFTPYPCQPQDLAPRSRSCAARGFTGGCVGSGINQMFGLHLSFSLSLSDNIISILIDVPLGFGWAQLCRQPYTGNHFPKQPTLKMVPGTRNAKVRQTLSDAPVVF